MKLSAYYSILKQSGREWLDDKAPLLGAALAFYTVLSIGPLLLIIIAVAGLVFGVDAVSGHVVTQIESLIGKDGASIIQTIIKKSYDPNASIIAILIGVATLIIGASGVFGQLQDALNSIWKVEPRPQSLLSIIKNRFISFSMVLGTGFLLLVSLFISAAISFLNEYTAELLPGSAFLIEAINFIVTFIVTTILFALIYKILPDVIIKWRDVWIGAIITSALFTIGKFFIGLYLGHSSFSSTYGAAGSIIVILIWVYYSAQILFFGAELTKVYALKSGREILPAKNALKS